MAGHYHAAMSHLRHLLFSSILMPAPIFTHATHDAAGRHAAAISTTTAYAAPRHEPWLRAAMGRHITMRLRRAAIYCRRLACRRRQRFTLCRHYAYLH